MSTARKARIVEAAVPEYESAVADAMNNIADALRTCAGVFASVAAGANTQSPGDQRNMAGVIYADAQERFGDVLKKLDPKTQKELEAWLDGLCKGKR
jgi:hypothetical protein